MATTHPLSETAIANMGGFLLNEVALTELSQGTSPYARFCQREFGYVRDEEMKKHPWSFNKEMAVLAPNATAPTFRWKYAYTLPADCLRLHTIRQYVNGPKAAYELFSGNRVFTDVPSALYIVYGKRITNTAEFDPLFARAMGYRLGVMGSMMVTGKSSYFDKASVAYASAMYDAVHTNALEKGSDEYVDTGFAGAQVNVLDARGAGLPR